MTDIVVNKVQSIQRCVKRAREEHAAAGNLATDHTRQDAAILNVIRACEQTIDLTNHLVRRRKLGIPTDTRETFELLFPEVVDDRDLIEKLKRMVGFRNTAVHQYQDIDLRVVETVITEGLDDLLTFTDRVMETEDAAE